MSKSSSSVLQTWHRMVEARDPSGLQQLLADDAVFHSPVVHTPQAGKAITSMYLSAAFSVLMNESFKYVREIESASDALLEFEVELDGIQLNGVDLITWNEQGQIIDFKVMVRPLKAINLLHQKMGEMLQRMK